MILYKSIDCTDNIVIEVNESASSGELAGIMPGGGGGGLVASASSGAAAVTAALANAAARSSSLAAQHAALLDVVETASEAWSMDAVLASDSESLRLGELDNEDTASVAR